MNDLVYAGEARPHGVDEPDVCSGFKIIYFNRGGEVLADGSLHSVESGGAAVIPPLVSHTLKCDEGDLCAVLERALLPVKKITTVCAADCKGLYEAIRDARRYLNADGGKAVIAGAYGNLIAAFVTACAAPKKYSPVVNAVIADIEKSLGDCTYSLEAFIRTLPLNYDYVRKLFNKEVGVTPHEYLVRARMERAKAIMLSGVTNRYSSYTVSQIAEACGFAEPLYFSQVFKKYFGVAPSRFMKDNS